MIFNVRPFGLNHLVKEFASIYDEVGFSCFTAWYSRCRWKFKCDRVARLIGGVFVVTIPETISGEVWLQFPSRLASFSNCSKLTFRQERERIRCVECIGHVLSVQDTADAIEKVRVVFDPYVKGLAQLVQHQVLRYVKLVTELLWKMYCLLYWLTHRKLNR